jgi:hypothetical protein
MDNIADFLKAIDGEAVTSLDKAHAVLWWLNSHDPIKEANSHKICKIIENIGHPKQNSTRLDNQLFKSRLVCKGSNKDSWRLHLQGSIELGNKYESFFHQPKKPNPTNSILPSTLFKNTRGYMEKIVNQINGSYDNGLYDCCAVMCRRILETLIIEVYESAGKANEIKDSGGHFYMFADLLKIFEKDTSFHISRNTKQGLNEFKKLGDLSAHNRRFNARVEDIDRIRAGIRVTSEELLHLAKLL